MNLHEVKEYLVSSKCLDSLDPLYELNTDVIHHSESLDTDSKLLLGLVLAGDLVVDHNVVGGAVTLAGHQGH